MNERKYEPPVAFRPKANAIVTWLVVGEFEKPGLRKVPQCMGGQGCCVCSMDRILAWKSAVSSGEVHLGGLDITIPGNDFVSEPRFLGDKASVLRNVV